MTEFGSVYNNYKRIKFDGSLHDRGRTFFICDSQLNHIQKVLKWENHSGQSVSLQVLYETLCLVVINKKTNSPINDKCRKINAKIRPKIGLTPIEIGDDWYHIGHKIISIGGNN